jgi:sterol desaturase/sphingolipid hydroxylase (fatty acid hydroxylase superfamily)
MMRQRSPEAAATSAMRVRLPSAVALRQVAVEAAFTVALIVALVYESRKLVPAMSGKPQEPIGPVLVATLLPFGTLLLLSLVERLFPPAGPRKSLKQWFLHLQINIFWSIAAGFLFVLAIMAASALGHSAGFEPGLIDLRFAAGKGMAALLGAVWVSAIIGDFFFYWYHRTLHKVHLLWQIHKMHHMDQELDALTVFRDNWLDTVGSALFTALPMTLLFKLDTLDPWQLGLLGGTGATALSTLLTLGHMNVRLQVGKASVLFCSPQIHRIHHSRLPQHFDRNFAVVFPLWDFLFGTYYSPARNEFPPTGVPHEKEIQSFWEAQTFTLREWWKMFRVWSERKAPASKRNAPADDHSRRGASG